jgi:glycosyltransferase involved in cell wall biosynthesis
MKILYLITKAEAGGAQTHVADLCRYFVSRGDEIAVMSRGGGWLKEECKKMNVSFVINEYFSNSANPFNIFKAIKKIRKYCAEFRPDIVHCHSSAAAFLGRLAIKGKIRTIYTAHGWGFNIGMNPIIRHAVLLVEKFTAKYTDKYICVSEFVKNLALKYNLAPTNKFVVIYNGVAPRMVWTNRNGHAEIRLAFVGRLAEPKKPELTIEALATLSADLKKKVRFTIIGDGPKRGMLERLAVDRGVMVDFTGDLPRELAIQTISQSDAFVFISAWEGLPYTILEAFSVGLPVIASDVGGVSEMVTPDNGILIKTNQPQEISEAIRKIAGDPSLRESMRVEALRTVGEKFSLSAMLAQVESVYKRN